MQPTAVKLESATIDDLLAIPEGERFHEIIAGRLLRQPSPCFRHGVVQAALPGLLGELYDRKQVAPEVPGGWRFVIGVEVTFAPTEIYRPDVSGWRRDRLPKLPDEWPVCTRPDWVCEILSASGRENDLFVKLRGYQCAQVPHCWIIDPVAEVLAVHRWTPEGYLLVSVVRGSERVRAEPFDAVEWSVRELVTDDD